MNFRSLIEKAMHEARDEFAAIVKQKLADLMGDAAHVDRSLERGRVRTTKATASAPPTRRRGKDGRARAPSEHMEKLKEKILGAMHKGEPMKKASIMKAARLAETEELRVGQILKRLKDARVLAMKGQRGAATYTLVSE
jgi:hypothetical protein